MNSKIFNKTGLEFFSGETAVLSGTGRSLEFLLLFGQAKRRRKIKFAPTIMKYSIHYAVSKCIFPDLGLFRSALNAFYIQIRWLKPTAMDTNLPLLQISALARLGAPKEALSCSKIPSVIPCAGTIGLRLKY